MNKKTIERRFRKSLAKRGIMFVPESAADRGLKSVAEITADVSRAGERLVNEAATTIKDASEKLRASVHRATGPQR